MATTRGKMIFLMRLLLPFLLFFFFLQSWLLCTVLVLFPATKHPPYSPDAQHSALIEHGAPAGQDLPKAYIIACYTYSFHAFLANMRAEKHALILAGQDQFYPNTSRDSLQEKNAKIGGKTAFVPHRNQLGSGFPAVLPAISRLARRRTRRPAGIVPCRLCKFPSSLALGDSQS
ncbi:MAG TPA: hypothetical protein VMW24_11365 [Sedimentisphaerales bacterium]|nr:hypothetical protein [Sedimentisphaerales bacterium]